MLSISHDPFVNDAFERFFVPLFGGTGSTVRNTTPPGSAHRVAARQLDLHQDASGWVLHADLPGIDPDSVDLELSEHELSITFEVPSSAPEGMRRIAGERELGTVSRRWRLRRAIDVDSVKVKFEDGQLRVEFAPRELRGARKISIKSAGGPQG